MADVITRFKLETTQYDSALRDASQGLAKLTEQLTLAGNEFGKFSQKDVEVAKSLGQVESGATNLKDKLRDLVSAYNNVAKAYNNLTNEQKQTDYGKAMASSLEQLQQRITATKNELYGMTDSTKQTGDGLGALNNIFGTSITKLAGWGAAIAGIKGALDVAKDAFFASEQNIDDWGRTIEANQAVYESFLTALNTGDIGGFLSRIGQITSAAMDAYNALDLLSTQKTIQSPQISVKQAEVARMRTMLQTGRYIAPADGRTPTSGLQTGDQLTKEQLNHVSKQLESAMGEIANITASQVKSATIAIDKLYNEQAAVLGVSKKKFLDATSSWEKFTDALDKASQYEQWKTKNTTYTTTTTSTGNVVRTANYNDANNPFRDWAWVSAFKDDGERFKRIVDEIQKRDAASSQLYSQYGQVYRRINRTEGVNPYGGTGGTKLTDPEKAQQKYEQAMANYSQALEQAALEVKAGTLSGVDAKKKELQAEESLWKAIGDARNIYDTPELKAEQQKVADRVKTLGGSITSLVAEQKAAQETARELASAQKKLSDAEAKMAEALKSNDYKAYTAAYKQYSAQQSEVQRLQPTIEPIIKMPQVEAPSIKMPQVEAPSIKMPQVEVPSIKMPQVETPSIKMPQVEVPPIPTMAFDVEARTESALDSLKEIEGITFDEKTLTVTANTQEALDALNNIDGITLSPKSLTVQAPDMKEVFSYTQNNMTALIARLNDQLAHAELGSTLYKNLTAQLADAQMLANLMQVAVKNGIDIAQFDPQSLFNKIFGETPGDYIQPEKWEEVRKQIEAIVGKPITIDVNTGQVNVNGKNKGVKTTGQKDSMSQLINNVHTMTRCLQDMGIEVPEGFQKVISSMNLVTTILQTIQSLSATSGAFGKGGGIIGLVGGLFSSIFGGFFANGGIVPHAANGMIVPGNDHADRTLIAASSGELILNAAQQNTVAGLLTQAPAAVNTGKTETYIESDQIRLVLANGAQAKGMTIGEYLGIG